MKTNWFILLCFVSLIVFSQENQTMEFKVTAKWESTFEIAKKRAKQERKPILIYFSGSDWCGPCIKLDNELFHTKKFQDYSKDKFILYMADFPRNKDLVSGKVSKTNKKLSKKYNNSFPMVLVISKKGKVLGERRGSYLPDSYYSFFESVLN
ncbi:Thioredoxin-related protein [Tenacibaculum sp. MAR_2009_124]|uniref:thioredoxin family protein n=1 Tax=Tenacibaculum sp. MAR_2009_124 TaxID=1250059 RepID=UPI00089B4D81|nr:thioredoxin family protein [Tenacibaculum sp. MAR_2009_124]SEB78017.1 Thioredoxin-related protein [Tenacibaculum sp. MAR_2009_124]